MSTIKIITSALVFCIVSMPVFGQDTSNINTTNTNVTEYNSNNYNENVNTNINTSTSTSTSVNTNTNNNTSTSTNNNFNITDSKVNSTNVNTSNTTNYSESISTNTNNTVITSNNNTTSNTTSNSVNQNLNVNQSTSENIINQTSTSNNTNINQNSSISDNTNTNYNENLTRNESIQQLDQEITSPPPSAIAPSIGSSYSQDLCTTGISGAIQTQIFGLSTGKSVTDENCERIKLSKTLYDMGMRVAAVALMCQDERVWTAMKMAGTPCPYEGMIGADALIAWETNKNQVPGYNENKDKNLTSTPNMPRNR